jgi:hypothetical protein
LLKCLEKSPDLLFRQADSAIFNLKANEQIIAVRLQQLRAQGNATLLGKLDGITGVVQQSLTKAGWVTAQPERY